MFSVSSYYLNAGKVFTENGALDNGYVKINSDKIESISESPNDGSLVYDLGENYLIPGYIDIHIHGRDGCDIMDASILSIKQISNSLAKHGVVGFLGTTVTAEWEQTLKAFKVMQRAFTEGLPGAQLLGAYNEGLFFTNDHKGAHNENYFLRLNRERIEAIREAAGPALKVIAMAPEFNDSIEMIEYMKALGIRVMLGHTNASCEMTEKAIESGACGGVHVFNGMSGIHHRKPGCAGALLLSNSAYTEVIADGIHLHPKILELVYRLKDKDKIVLISDCVNAGGLTDGQYKLGEMDVYVKDGIVKTKSGSLAGSTLTLDQAVKNFSKYARVSISEAITMASLNPAKLIGVDDRLGSIKKGKSASFSVVNKKFEVLSTIIDGRLVYDKLGINKSIPKRI